MVPHGDEIRPATEPLIQPLVGFFSEFPIDRPMIWDAVFYEGHVLAADERAASTPSSTRATSASTGSLQHRPPTRLHGIGVQPVLPDRRAGPADVTVVPLSASPPDHGVGLTAVARGL